MMGISAMDGYALGLSAVVADVNMNKGLRNEGV